jgi:hypothetical protein
MEYWGQIPLIQNKGRLRRLKNPVKLAFTSSTTTGDTGNKLRWKLQSAESLQQFQTPTSTGCKISPYDNFVDQRLIESCGIYIRLKHNS